MKQKNSNHQQTTAHEEPTETSKSQRKKDMLALKDLGAALVKLSTKELQKLPLDKHLIDNILQAQRIPTGSALKRQIQFIGKLLRTTDNEAVREAYSQLKQPLVEHNKQFKKIEKLRDKIISEGDTAIEHVLSIFPQASRQQLRQYVRNINLELAQQKPPAQQRKLFRYLRTLHESNTDSLE